VKGNYATTETVCINATSSIDLVISTLSFCLQFFGGLKSMCRQFRNYESISKFRFTDCISMSHNFWYSSALISGEAVV
jgi:hypothetical protein